MVFEKDLMSSSKILTASCQPGKCIHFSHMGQWNRSTFWETFQDKIPLPHWKKPMHWARKKIKMWFHECQSCLAAVVPDAIGSSSVFCNEWLFHVVPVCVVLCISGSCGCRSHWNTCMNAAWALFWGGSRSTKPCVFPCKVAAAGDERYLVCAAGAAGAVWFLLCVLQQWLFLSA